MLIFKNVNYQLHAKSISDLVSSDIAATLLIAGIHWHKYSNISWGCNEGQVLFYSRRNVDYIIRRMEGRRLEVR